MFPAREVPLSLGGGRLKRHRIELLPVTPTFLNLLAVSGVWRSHDLSSVRLVTYGTEPMPEATLVQARAVFPQAAFQQTYGLSELGVLRTKSRDDGSLWVKVGGEGFETKVVEGILKIRARSAMVGYLNAPQPFDPEGWFDTGDRVDVDGEWLRIHGRDSEMINVGGQKVFPSEVESVLLQMEGVREAAVRGEKHFLMGQVVVARMVLAAPEAKAALAARVRAFCRDRLAPYKVPVKVEIADGPLHTARFKRDRRGD